MSTRPTRRPRHVHREAHGEIPSEIIPVDLATVEAFLGRISDPRFANGAPVPDIDTGLRAIMVTDIVASTELTTRLGDLAALELVRVHDALVRRGLRSYAGHEVKHTGDGIMAAFNNAANAVRAAADIQRRFCEYNSEASEDIRIRIGIDAGEPVADHNDLFGATVHLAFRLCSEAEADGSRLRSRAGPLQARTGAICRIRRATLEGISQKNSGVPIRVAELNIVRGTHAVPGSQANFRDAAHVRSAHCQLPAKPNQSRVSRRQAPRNSLSRAALMRLVGVLDPVLELAVFLGKPLCHDV